MKFFKTTSTNSPNLTFYIPLEQSNILRFTHVLPIEKEEGEEKEEEKEFIGIEFNITAEQNYSVPLQRVRKIKQTKLLEEFQVEEVVKMLQPIIQRVDSKEEMEKLLEYLNSNCI